MIKHTPPMGWNSWNTFADNINEQVVRESAEAMVKAGLKDAGYEYVVIDDCWSLHERDKAGKLQADKKKFPSGMKAIADYIHSLGLKFGMYSCSGPLTCANYPASFDHEFTDAATFAEWGVDLLKYDYCYHPTSTHGKYLYRRMGTALANCGRDILFSACTWGADNTREWINQTGAGMWRSTGDIFDTFESLRDLIKAQYKTLPYGGVGCFNDMDMLVTGMHGKGHVGITGCTNEEYKLHMSVWSILASPLMIGCDIRNMDKETKELLTNKEMLAINQDVRGARAYMTNEEEVLGSPDMSVSPIFCRLLDNGDLALCFTNLDDTKRNRSVTADQMGLGFGTGVKLTLSDVWTGESFVMKNECILVEVQPHSCKYYRVKVDVLR